MKYKLSVIPSTFMYMLYKRNKVCVNVNTIGANKICVHQYIIYFCAILVNTITIVVYI